MKPTKPWANAHLRLKRLYLERVPEGMTQEQFGRLHGIGSQSMVAQYLNGDRPLNYDSAAKFARALRCTIYDFCPEMGDSLKNDIFPVLGKTLRRAALVVMAIFLPLQPDANAGTILHNSLPLYTLMNRLRRLMTKLQQFRAYRVAKA